MNLLKLKVMVGIEAKAFGIGMQFISQLDVVVLEDMAGGRNM